MKRLTSMVVILFIMYLAIQVLFNKFGNGHNSEYTISDAKNNYLINEVYTANAKDEHNNYYLTIKTNGVAFEMQTYAEFYGSEHIIKNIKYFSNNNYKCVLPIFTGGKLLYDIMCLKDKIITPYYFLIGQDSELDAFANSLSSVDYQVSNWQDNNVDALIDGPLTVYPKNIIKSHYVGINNYRGLYTISNDNLQKKEDIKLFNYDVYKRPLSGIIGKYYITADYSQSYAFNKFFVVNLISNHVDEITFGTRIDFDSYVQGIVGSSIYIFDRENKKQYEVITKTLSIVEIGNVDTGIKVYQDGVWSKASAYDAAINDITFNNVPIDTTFSGYNRVDKVGNHLSGFYYLYQKVGNTYHVYRANVQNRELKTYIFATNKIDNITYVKDYVYFTKDNTVKYFQDAIGVKTLFQNSEFAFNNSLYFNIYSK